MSWESNLLCTILHEIQGNPTPTAARKDFFSLVVRECSCAPAPKPVLQSMHYATSVISRSCPALRRHHVTLFNKEPKGDFFLKNREPKSSLGPQGRASSLGFATHYRDSSDAHLPLCKFVQWLSWVFAKKERKKERQEIDISNLYYSNYSNIDWTTTYSHGLFLTDCSPA